MRAAILFPFNWTDEPGISANELNIFTDLVLDCLELCKYTSLAKEIHGQCQMDSYEFTAEVFSCICSFPSHFSSTLKSKSQ